jgi:hypothetical protein
VAGQEEARTCPVIAVRLLLIQQRRLTMKFKAPLFLLAALLGAQFLNAQQPAMSATTGLGPGSIFTLFITFQEPMPKIEGIQCGFGIVGSTKPGQEEMNTILTCNGSFKKIDDTHFSANVAVPVGIAEGDYRLDYIVVIVESTGHRYNGANLPSLSPVAIINPERLKFSPIKKLETKP